MNIIEEFNKKEDYFQKELVEYALNNYEEVRTDLLQEMKYFSDNMEKWKKEPYPMSVLYALNILAQKKEKELFPILIKVFSQKNYDYFMELGDAFTDYIENRIISVFNGDFEKMEQLIKNKELEASGRIAFLECYTYFANQGLISKEKLEEFLISLIKHYNYEDDEIYTTIAEVIMDSDLYNLKDEVKKLFKLGLIDIHMFGEYDAFIDYLFDDKKLIPYHPITNTIEEMATWACFKNRNEFQKTQNAKSLEKALQDILSPKISSTKIGRNDPCPCGSGKKYKKCCMDKPNKKILPYQSLIDKELEKYPKRKTDASKRDLYDFWKEAYIEIDELMYKALVHKIIPFRIQRDYVTENRNNLEYLDEAFHKIKKVMQKENIQSIEEYDKKISIHYDLEYFLERYHVLLKETKNFEKLQEVTEFWNSLKESKTSN